MKVSERPSLRQLNSFGVDAKAGLRIDIESEEDVLALPAFDFSHDLLLGGGSNVLLVTDVPGTVFINRIQGRQIIEQDDDHILVEIGAGEDWHEFVAWSVDQGYSGVENLALIPGSVGAAPIQNIGAYGVELASVVESVTAWDFRLKNWQIFEAPQCGFAYRDSIFKSKEPGRYLVTSLRIRLNKAFQPEVSYQGLKQEIEQATSNKLTQRQVFDAVVRLRKRKLPSPNTIGNAGSFFKNPMVSQTHAAALRQEHPGLPGWPTDNDREKLSAAWMIQQCGLKGYRDGPVGVSDQHALVLVNHGEGTGKQIWNLAQHVQRSVQRAFDVLLEPEPRIINF